MQRLYLLAASAHAWVLILILALAFAMQFALGEPPCPLCVIQRIALMMCALGPAYLLIAQRGGELTPRDVAVGSGIGILAGLLGLAATSRQVLLHILPNDPGFGSPVLGLHLYTWCLISILAHVAASAFMLVGSAWLPQEQEQRQTPRWPLTGISVAALAVIIAANVLSVVAEAGWSWQLPADPTSYLLFK
jgi:disulfide bond formation protein DsbB